MSFLDQAIQIQNWLAKRQPDMAKLMVRTNRVLQIIGEHTGSGKTKAAGLILNELANLIMKWNKKVLLLPNFQNGQYQILPGEQSKF